MEQAPPLFHKHYQLTNWVLDRLERYPRSVRIILADRMGGLCLDILELIVQVLYTKRRTELLREINLQLERLRILVRLSKDRGHISLKQYEHCTKGINEVGAMVGGWLKGEAKKRQ